MNKKNITVYGVFWYIVKINYDKTEKGNIKIRTTGDYHVIFLSYYLSDNHLCDDNAQWWPLWYGYNMNKKNIPVYGTQNLFRTHS